MRIAPLFILMFPTISAHAAPIDFNRDVRPILSEKCFHCHGPDEGSREAELRLDIREDALKDRDGIRAIVPGKLDDSELVTRITSTDPDELMPPPKEHQEITPKEVDILKRWISEGAPYAKHWSFEAPKRPEVPAADKERVRTPIDAFVSANLAKQGLKLSPDVDRATLLRRVSLDLIGLPPTPAEVDAFVQDTKPEAYERAIDRLLDSPRYGERWARMWMDCARYADSTGYGSDAMRPFMWPWRDWVIGAFNKNMPYDQFTIEQIAGDLLPKSATDQVLATTFNRNTMTNIEGGTIDEEYRVAAVKDRVATTMQVWTGLTAGCAQCHTHKFDPISHREYYSLFAIFNQTEDNDQPSEEPRMAVPTAEEEKRTKELNTRIAALNTSLTAGSPEFDAQFRKWEADAIRPVPWAPLMSSEINAVNGTKFDVLPDKSVIARSGDAATETIVLRAKPSTETITALRVELLPDPSLPANGPGLAGNGNVVLSEVSASLQVGAPTQTRARYIRVELPGIDRILSLAEVEAFSLGQNIARKGKATQSSVDFDGPPQHAIDGNTEGIFSKGKSVTHTRKENNPWWEVDLGREQPIETVVVWNRTDTDVRDRLKGARVTLFDAERKLVAQETINDVPNPKTKPLFGNGQQITLVNASSDFAQPKFDAANVLDHSDKTGWAIGGGEGKPHALVVECSPAIQVPAGSELMVTLAQNYGERHTLGRFRVSTTNAATPVRELSSAVRAAVAVESAKRTPAQRDTLLAYFRPLSSHYALLNKQIAAAKADLDGIKPIRVPVMRDLPTAKHRKSFIFNKGNYLLPGDEVKPALLKEFPPAIPGQINRLSLAQWIVSPENPLTARVTVNRFWSQLFGKGLVESEEDFGTQGTLPSNPELLDWLAVEFRESGWDVKKLLKLIVTSTTYRQTSKATPELLEKDPVDRMLSRYPRRRLGAEELRDQALAVSGLLSSKIGGPSVYPPQPDGLWNVAFNGGSRAEYKTSTGEDRWRRGLYTIWRRTMPNPTMTTFDAPSRETCTVRRIPTNTPLQAFVTLNDPVYIECAQALARRIMKEGGADPESRIRYALRLCLARTPEDNQVSTLRHLFDDELLNYQQLPDAASKLATQPLGPLPPGVDVAEAAAWTSVANVILNLDGFLSRN